MNFSKKALIPLLTLLLLIIPAMSFAAGTDTVPSLFGIRLEFIVFALTLVGVAVFHNKTMFVALTGLAVLIIIKYSFLPGYSFIEHIAGTSHAEGEWRTLLNLTGLLFGFGILAKIFEESGVPVQVRPGAPILSYLFLKNPKFRLFSLNRTSHSAKSIKTST